ncbi:MAG TPA: hypothetical protein DCZ01_08555 [Elusimicrobia bacterium]|nr:MAG: hypothetical protein A2X37_05060 [Elusimicrobia bacterium GWA2_66_18]OGR76921.1 MAG: hypothetical protein A2X40_04005 [Elusimicrobia bacterium GWC2_65_9]HAZ08553.1 hypothetical protein [Elusimicrobiota bacterium]
MNGDPSEIELLVLAGRHKEAALALRRSAAAGTSVLEVFIWLGRIAENRGRLEQAENVFRKALDVKPASPLPRVELSRFLEKTGRSAEAYEVLKETVAQAEGKLNLLCDIILRGGFSEDAGKSLYALMEFNMYRRVFVERVIQNGENLDRIEAAMRAVLSVVPQPGARILLTEVLIARGRLKAAEEALIPAFGAGAEGAENSRIEALLELIALGRYAPAVERALLGCLARAGHSDKLVLEWPQIFSALMCARKYRAAFRLGEAMLDQLGGFQSPGQLMWPWWREIRRAVVEDRFIAEELRRIRAASKGGKFSRWFAYYRAILLGDSGCDEEAMAEYESIEDSGSPRYSWMSQSCILVKLGMLDFDGAIAISRRILRHAPSHWWVRCRMAEAYLAKGDKEQALREFERARKVGDATVRREVLTWNGEIFLWLGEYKKALEMLDEAVALGAQTFIYGWRGATLWKLGRRDEALADLDLAVELDPKDFEARAWRGEVYRVMGRHDESIRDLDHVIASAPDNLWAYFNRALIRDGKGLAADFSAIPREVTAFIGGELGLPRGSSFGPAEMRKILTAGLEMAKGIRRSESYVRRIWMAGRS